MTILHTGSSPSRPSQRWTAPAPRPRKPPTAPPSAHRSLCTEPVGTPTLRPQTPPASTPRPQASRRPSDPPAKPLQIYYRAQHWTATRERGEAVRTHRSCPSPSPPLARPPLPSHLLSSEEASSRPVFFSPCPQMRCDHRVMTIFSFLFFVHCKSFC